MQIRSKSEGSCLTLRNRVTYNKAGFVLVLRGLIAWLKVLKPLYEKVRSVLPPMNLPRTGMLLASIGVVAREPWRSRRCMSRYRTATDLGFAQGRHFRTTMAAYLNSSNDLQRVITILLHGRQRHQVCISAPQRRACLSRLRGGAARPSGGRARAETWLWALNMADEIHSLRGLPTRAQAPLAGGGGGACTAILNTRSCVSSRTTRTAGIALRHRKTPTCSTPAACATAVTAALRSPRSCTRAVAGLRFRGHHARCGPDCELKFVEATASTRRANVFLTRDPLEAQSASDAARRARIYRRFRILPMWATRVVILPCTTWKWACGIASACVHCAPVRRPALACRLNQYQRLVCPSIPIDPVMPVPTVQRLVESGHGALDILGDQSNPEHLGSARLRAPEN